MRRRRSSGRGSEGRSVENGRNNINSVVTRWVNLGSFCSSSPFCLLRHPWHWYFRTPSMHYLLHYLPFLNVIEAISFVSISRRCFWALKHVERTLTDTMFFGNKFVAMKTKIACERECSRGENYRLVKLTIIDFNSKKERDDKEVMMMHAYLTLIMLMDGRRMWLV